MQKHRDKYIRTTNLSQAIYLYAQDQQIAGVNNVGEGQKEFVFIKTDKLEELIDLYKFGDRNDERLFIEVHKYEQARRDLLDRLKD